MLSEDAIWTLLADVKDPEIPVLSVLDMGIIRAVSVTGDAVEIVITPTYSGCPAMDVIAMDIRLKLIERGIRKVQIRHQLSPAWTTDWMSEAGREKLRAFGIAPPNPKQQFCSTDMFVEEAVQCPRCGSWNTELISQFASTACKSMYRCRDCKEAFDHFKCH
ncbi:phenylacetate-CoA oxygenase subunit PaaJ [Flaviaesturariibacter flavus]|uniref:Phenylacetate-CoA oxygenase subunit PaaJ n=1 Tax=Flaviaesturariibacter flavus TaxID=2502780 RepID=A0A4R1BAK2_9BACT|nr:1,2-phenylacetyl-CoA epoxidase subunit PaaD [Flaviaesturariibacter flavus]TCJ13991.1 phenylacetate-CoA oxygenase subunit PaaJ [Flaviaesturariibacter flavus]